MEIELMGRTQFHPVYVCDNLNQKAIMGIDLMKKFQVNYDVCSQKFRFKDNDRPVLELHSEE